RLPPTSGPSAPAISETQAATITALTDHAPNGATNANGRYSAASETTSESSFRYAPSADAWPKSRASIPSIAFMAIRSGNHAGSSRNAQVLSAIVAMMVTVAPTATDTTSAAIVT